MLFLKIEFVSYAVKRIIVTTIDMLSSKYLLLIHINMHTLAYLYTIQI